MRTLLAKAASFCPKIVQYFRIIIRSIH